MINKEQLEDYLQQNIPISKALGIKILSASDQEVTVSAPFLSNINHKKTVFGGSLNAVATLACWSLAYINLLDLNPIELVITHSDVDYISPVTNDFTVQCKKPIELDWNRFLKILNLKGKARIQMEAKIFQDEKLAVFYEGVFAGIKKQPS